MRMQNRANMNRRMANNRAMMGRRLYRNGMCAPGTFGYYANASPFP